VGKLLQATLADAVSHPPGHPVPPIKIVVVLPGLGAGGTEHVVNVLANEWAARGRAVTILTFESADFVPYYPFVAGVAIRWLALMPRRAGRIRSVAATLQRIRLLRRALLDVSPDVVVSFLTRTNVMSLIAASGLNVPVVVSERNNPAAQKVGRVWGLLRTRLYPSAFGLVTMTRGAMDYFDPRMRRRSWVIPNPVDLPKARRAPMASKVLTAVGRLVPQKGFDLLLRAFAEISNDFPDWRLVIWGEGEERARLEAERSRLGLDERVEMPGVTARPGIWIDGTDAFVLSSRFEGWGIVLLEAMAAGLPVVSFDCQWGPREMIEDEVNGILVTPESVGALAFALRRLLGDEALRARLGRAATKSTRRFTTANVVDRWDEVVDAATIEGKAG
jgi:glycosyltransferase involved in cell wall biosynthesis